MTPHESEKLERLIQSTVSGLPARPAPRSLESRVFAEIARRASLPWYRRSFSHWPVAMRGAFLVLSAAAAAATVFAVLPISTAAPAGVQASIQQGSALIGGLRAIGSAVGVTASNLFNRVPTTWLYGTAAVVAACYGALMALGAVAYRLLRPQPQL